jgi:hypothetical protein
MRTIRRDFRSSSPAAGDRRHRLSSQHRRFADSAGREIRAIGAGGAVFYASGFAETGQAGRKWQDSLVTASGDLAVVGPNRFGLINYVNNGSMWLAASMRDGDGFCTRYYSRSDAIRPAGWV